MAEIKSTMEMVMARAAKMCAEAKESDLTEGALHAGMKAGADFLNGREIDLAALLKQYQGPELEQCCKGLLQSFMRQLNLPRDDSQPWEGALRGMMELAKLWPTDITTRLSSLAAEIRNILSRYFEHKQQLRKQLEDNFATQAAQLQQTLAQQIGMQMKISPSQHPKFQEEWQKVLAQMDDQYLNALKQYKDAINQLFGGS